MIDFLRCNRIAGDCGVAPVVIENDYLVEAVLSAISAEEELANILVFRGGTCLHKVYFSDYRYSEDLDFIFPGEIKIDTVRIKLNALLEKLKNEIPGIIGWDEQREKDRLQIFINYDIVPENVRRKKQLKLDVCAADEMPGHITGKLNLVYDEFNKPETYMKVCILESVISDKISRIISINKEARDIYDLKHLYESNVDLAIIEKEFRKNNSSGIGIRDLVNKVKDKGFRTAWEQRLGHQMRVLPEFDSFVKELHHVIRAKYKDLFE